jgi:hypothetical protein
MLAISRFRTALELTTRRATGISLVDWSPDGQFRDAVEVRGEKATERIPVHPDAFFQLGIGGEVPTTVRCFLEVDRSTMDVKRYLTKLRGYWAYWRNGKYEERIGARHFLVVTVTKSAERAAHLRDACREALGERDTRMFVFAQENAYLPLDSGRILEPIWHAASEGVHSLLE